MAIIIRIDVDRPYGKKPLYRHILSRLASDFYQPVCEKFGYLKEIKLILELLNKRGTRAYFFFRRCTLPSKSVLELLRDGNHVIGLHLEDSRSFETFFKETAILERHLDEKINAVSKHGSGGTKYGFHHYAPYEPEKYIDWAQQNGMKVFFGNLQNPELKPSIYENGFCVYPSAFWLEPAWRDTGKYSVDWLIKNGNESDIVLLIHPENVFADRQLFQDFKRLLDSVKTRILE